MLDESAALLRHLSAESVGKFVMDVKHELRQDAEEREGKAGSHEMFRRDATDSDVGYSRVVPSCFVGDMSCKNPGEPDEFTNGYGRKCAPVSRRAWARMVWKATV